MPKLSFEDRILLLIGQRDLDSGRDGVVSDWFGDFREASFMFSISFLHSSEIVFLNILQWDELREYGQQPDKLGEGVIQLPPEYIGLADIPVPRKRSFSLALKKLLQNGHINAFSASMAGIKGLGGKTIPALQLWSKQNRDKPRDIVAISLTAKGFARAKELIHKHSIMMPWQVHQFAVTDRVLAEWLTGRNKNQQPSGNGG